MYEYPTVYVIEDDSATREALCWLLSSVGLNISAFASAADFMQTLNPDLNGCVLTDVRMPLMSGLELQRELKAHQVQMQVILLTGYADIPMAVRAIKEGAYDILEKPYNDQMLLDIVQSALALCLQQRQEQARMAAFRSKLSLLTDREKQVLKLITHGQSNSQAANELKIGIRAIETYRSNAMKKMKAKSLANLVYMCAKADQSGINQINHTY